MLDGERLGVEARAQGLDLRGGQLRQVDRFAVEDRDRRLGVRERVEVLDEPTEPQHLLVQRGEPRGRRFGDLVDQLLEVALQDRERGADLVREVAHQAPARAALTLERLRHLVERVARALRAPRVPTGLCSCAEVAGLQPPRSGGEPTQRRGDPPADERRAKQRDHDRDRRPEQHRAEQLVAEHALRVREPRGEAQLGGPDLTAVDLDRGAEDDRTGTGLRPRPRPGAAMIVRPSAARTDRTAPASAATTCAAVRSALAHDPARRYASASTRTASREARVRSLALSLLVSLLVVSSMTAANAATASTPTATNASANRARSDRPRAVLSHRP